MQNLERVVIIFEIPLFILQSKLELNYLNIMEQNCYIQIKRLIILNIFSHKIVKILQKYARMCMSISFSH